MHTVFVTNRALPLRVALLPSGFFK